MELKKIVVTGLGMLTGLGLNVEDSWRGVVEGRSVAKRFTLFDPTGLSSTFGVELPQGANDLFSGLVKPRSRNQMTRGTLIAVAAAQEAILDSGLDKTVIDHTRIGVVVGSTGTGYAPAGNQNDENRILRNMSNAPAAWISLRNKYKGPSFCVSTACSSGVYALNSAWWLLQSGQCDVVIAGAADSSLNYLDLQGFGSLLALSEQNLDPATASRPFDFNRTGFVMGEGGGMLVLETLDHAKKRNARVYSKLAQPAISSEAYNILSPHPGGVGMAETMKQAIELAGLSSSNIDYINAHGTSTTLNDLYETQAIKTVFGDHAQNLVVSSTKSTTGHCLAGAAGVESVICCKAIVEEAVPPTINLTTPDLQCDLDYVPGKARKAALRHVMCNSFAFGGHNGVAIFSRFTDGSGL